MAGVPLQGCRRRFRGVLAAGRAHRRGGGGLIARTGCRGRVRALGFVHLKARGKDGSEPGAALRQVGMLVCTWGVLGSPVGGVPVTLSIVQCHCSSHQLPSMEGLQYPSVGGCSYSPGCICTALQSAEPYKPGSSCTSSSTKRNYAISPGCAPAMAQALRTARSGAGSAVLAMHGSAPSGPEHTGSRASLRGEGRAEEQGGDYLHVFPK